MLLYVYEAEDSYVLGCAFQDTDYLPVHSFMKYEAVFLYLNLPYRTEKTNCAYQKGEALRKESNHEKQTTTLLQQRTAGDIRFSAGSRHAAHNHSRDCGGKQGHQSDCCDERQTGALCDDLGKR